MISPQLRLGRLAVRIRSPGIHIPGYMISPQLGLERLAVRLAGVGIPRSPRKSMRSTAVFQKPWKGGIVQPGVQTPELHALRPLVTEAHRGDIATHNTNGVLSRLRLGFFPVGGPGKSRRINTPRRDANAAGEWLEQCGCDRIEHEHGLGVVEHLAHEGVVFRCADSGEGHVPPDRALPNAGPGRRGSGGKRVVLRTGSWGIARPLWVRCRVVSGC